MKLFVVTVREEGNENCQREVFTLARNLQEAAKKAERHAAGSLSLYKPHAFKVELLGPVAQ